jgi:hypothetical protein|tara:strand:+ start:43 stop:312 length:270 start_codon:yes stop_codon:yes gene_type:complete
MSSQSNPKNAGRPFGSGTSEPSEFYINRSTPYSRLVAKCPYTRVQNMRKEWQEVLMSMKALSCEQKEKLNNVFEDMSTASYDLARSESE